MSRQLALPFTHVPRYRGITFLEASSNAEALALLDQPSIWPHGRLAIFGPEGCGKTHLLTRWAERQGACVIDAGQLALDPLRPPPAGPIAIDDADLAAERPLLHLLNAGHEAGVHVVLTSRTPPARWAVALPDLASRLRAMLVCEIRPAEDLLLDALFTRLIADRHLRLSAPLQAWLRLRLPRSAAAIRDAASLLDRRSLEAGTPVTRPIAQAVLAELTGDEAKIFHDDWDPIPAAASHSAPGLL
jgi:chromosomal replication initiation ATPase DnaA